MGTPPRRAMGDGVRSGGLTSHSAIPQPWGAGQGVAVVSMGVNAALAAAKIVIGTLAGSTSVVADGLESASDIFSAALVYAGLRIASRPPDQDHPYGHGRAEILAGLIVGVVIALTGFSICVQSLRNVSAVHPPPANFGIWPLIASIAVKLVMLTVKFHYGRKMRSASLVSDAWNDTVDVLSGGTALAALNLTLSNPARFLAADHFGGFAVGVIVITLGLRVTRDTSLELMDTMPSPDLMQAIRAAARQVDGVRGVEKCWARKTGLGYHVDLHLEVDPGISVADGHGIAERVRHRIRGEVNAVADVLVHVEPAPSAHQPSADRAGR